LTSIIISEGSDGVEYVFTIKQEGSNTAEDLSNYTTAVMYVTSTDLKTLHDTITLAITTPASGILTYTTDPTDTLPSVSAGTKKLRLKAQIKITGTGLIALTELLDFLIINDISS